MCHYIASTKIPKFWKRKKDEESPDADGGIEAVSIIQNKKEKANKDLIRRPTIADLSSYHKRTKGNRGEHLNLEKEFLENVKNTSKLQKTII